MRGCVVHSFLPCDRRAGASVWSRDCPASSSTAAVTDRDELLDSALTLNAQGVAVLHGLVDEELVAETVRRSLRLYCWTVNDDAEIRRLIACGVDGITSDYPERVRAALATS